jgi:hypothetical protein
MNRTIKICCTPALFMGFILLAESGFADGPPPPPPGGGHAGTGNQPAGGGAPIDDGTVFLGLLSLAYGIKELGKFNFINRKCVRS